MKRAELTRIPNLLCLLRISLVPVLFLLAWQEARTAFLILFIIAGLTDALDGFFARLLKQASPFGAWMDSFADQFFYPSIALWVWTLEPGIVRENRLIVATLVGLFLLRLAVSLLKHRRMVPLHLYSSKAFAVALYAYMIAVLLFPPSQAALLALWALGCVSQIEEMAVLLTRKRPDEKIGTIFRR